MFLPIRPLRRAAMLLVALSFLLLTRPASAQSADLLKSGPMVGYGTHRAAAVWVQTTQPAGVQLRYWNVQNPDSTLTTPTRRARRANDQALTFEIGDLEPGQTYGYDVLIDGEAVERPYPTRLQTQPLWEWRADPPTFTVAFGSCNYINEPPYERPGDLYGQKPFIFESIEAKDPDVMLWLGDNTYYREVDWSSPQMMSARYAHTRKAPEIQALLGHTHNYAIWDDHDYGPNNSNRSYHLKGATLDIFKRYWANTTYGLPSVPGVFTKFTWGDVDFFLLDDRYYRSPDDAPRDGDKTMWGEAQLQWLIDALTTSRAPFKMVVNGGQVLNPYDFAETLARYPRDRRRLLDAIQQRDIEGVVFLSGDRHYTELLKLTPDGFYPLYDFTSSPLTASPYDPEREYGNKLRVDGTLTPERNFGTLTFSGPRTDRTLTMRTFDAEGNQLWEHSLRARDLHVADDE